METNLIKNICTVSKMSQIELSRRFGIPYRTVQDWYSGKRTPPEYVVNMMIELLSKEYASMETNKLFLISNAKGFDYCEFDSAVVIAEDEKEALKILSDNKIASDTELVTEEIDLNKKDLIFYAYHSA